MKELRADLLSCHAESFVFSLLSCFIQIKTYRNIILPVVLYGCEIWSLTLKKEHRLGMFENRVLRKIFGPKRDEETRAWRRLRNNIMTYLILAIKPGRISWAGRPGRKNHLEDQHIDGWIIFNESSRSGMRRHRLD
jgi:hypothetical protein